MLRPFVPLGKSETQYSEAEVFPAAIAEGTAYLLYQKIKEAADPQLQSRSLFRQLEQSYYLNLAQNLFWLEQFFKDYSNITEGIQAILLKGISLFSTVYQNPGLRHLGDIDLLIRKVDYPEIRKRLECAGYLFTDDMQRLADPRSLNSIMCHKSSSAPPRPALHIHWHLIVYLALQKGPFHKLRFLYRCFFPALEGRRRDAFWYFARRCGRGLKRVAQLLVSLWKG